MNICPWILAALQGLKLLSEVADFVFPCVFRTVCRLVCLTDRAVQGRVSKVARSNVCNTNGHSCCGIRPRFFYFAGVILYSFGKTFCICRQDIYQDNEKFVTPPPDNDASFLESDASFTADDTDRDGSGYPLEQCIARTVTDIVVAFFQVVAIDHHDRIEFYRYGTSWIAQEFDLMFEAVAIE